MDVFIQGLKKDWDPATTILVFGHWTNSGYLRGNAPSLGRSIHEDFHRHGYQTFLINEAYSSIKCHICFGWNEKFQPDPKAKPDRPKLVHGLLRCSTCGTKWDRDICGADNIQYLAVEFIQNRTRPSDFTRRAI